MKSFHGGSDRRCGRYLWTEVTEDIKKKNSMNGTTRELAEFPKEEERE